MEKQVESNLNRIQKKENRNFEEVEKRSHENYKVQNENQKEDNSYLKKNLDKNLESKNYDKLPNVEEKGTQNNLNKIEKIDSTLQKLSNKNEIDSPKSQKVEIKAFIQNQKEVEALGNCTNEGQQNSSNSMITFKAKNANNYFNQLINSPNENLDKLKNQIEVKESSINYTIDDRKKGVDKKSNESSIASIGNKEIQKEIHQEIILSNPCINQNEFLIISEILKGLKKMEQNLLALNPQNDLLIEIFQKFIELLKVKFSDHIFNFISFCTYQLRYNIFPKMTKKIEESSVKIVSLLYEIESLLIERNNCTSFIHIEIILSNLSIIYKHLIEESIVILIDEIENANNNSSGGYFDKSLNDDEFKNNIRVNKKENNDYLPAFQIKNSKNQQNLHIEDKNSEQLISNKGNIDVLKNYLSKLKIFLNSIPKKEFGLSQRIENLVINFYFNNLEKHFNNILEIKNYDNDHLNYLMLDLIELLNMLELMVLTLYTNKEFKFMNAIYIFKTKLEEYFFIFASQLFSEIISTIYNSEKETTKKILIFLCLFMKSGKLNEILGFNSEDIKNLSFLSYIVSIIESINFENLLYAQIIDIIDKWMRKIIQNLQKFPNLLSQIEKNLIEEKDEKATFDQLFKEKLKDSFEIKVFLIFADALNFFQKKLQFKEYFLSNKFNYQKILIVKKEPNESFKNGQNVYSLHCS